MQVTKIGLDIAKNVFQVHGIAVRERTYPPTSSHRRASYTVAASEPDPSAPFLFCARICIVREQARRLVL
jgi:hypothetical protein